MLAPGSTQPRLFFIAATQSITGAAVGAGAGGALAHALAGVWVAGGLLGIALLFRTPPTVGKPIVDSRDRNDSKSGLASLCSGAKVCPIL